MVQSANHYCPLCATPLGSELFHSDRRRDYYRCSLCGLTSVAVSQRPTIEAEKAEYDKHQNSPEDLRYRTFLSRLYIPMQERINPNSYGLDFGSGPGPTLSVMFEEAGHTMGLYDPFYASDNEVLNSRYDFITASEVLEHLHDPKEDLALLWSLLKPGGWLGVMTKLARDQAAFSQWHYISDPTHVCFFSKQTMEWLAKLWNSSPVFVASDVILFRKNRSWVSQHRLSKNP